MTEINRRQFLRTAGMTAASSLIPGSVLSAFLSSDQGVLAAAKALWDVDGDFFNLLDQEVGKKPVFSGEGESIQAIENEFKRRVSTLFGYLSQEVLPVVQRAQQVMAENPAVQQYLTDYKKIQSEEMALLQSYLRRSTIALREKDSMLRQIASLDIKKDATGAIDDVQIDALGLLEDDDPAAYEQYTQARESIESDDPIQQRLFKALGIKDDDTKEMLIEGLFESGLRIDSDEDKPYFETADPLRCVSILRKNLLDNLAGLRYHLPPERRVALWEKARDILDDAQRQYFPDLPAKQIQQQETDPKSLILEEKQAARDCLRRYMNDPKLHMFSTLTRGPGKFLLRFTYSGEYPDHHLNKLVEEIAFLYPEIRCRLSVPSESNPEKDSEVFRPHLVLEEPFALMEWIKKEQAKEKKSIKKAMTF